MQLSQSFCQEGGILLQKYRDRNGSCATILFKGMGVRGRFDSPDLKKLQYSSNLCHSTPPICNAVSSWLLKIDEERETPQCTFNLYCGTLPMPPWGFRKVPDYRSEYHSLSRAVPLKEGTPHSFFLLCFKINAILGEVSQISCLLGTAPLQKCVGDFCCISFGGFCRGFSWRIFEGTFSHKNEEKKSATKSAKKSGGSKIKVREKSVLPKSGPKPSRGYHITIEGGAAAIASPIAAEWATKH